MRFASLAIAVVGLALLVTGRAWGQTTTAFEMLEMHTDSAVTWTDHGVSIAQLHGSVTISLDHTSLNANEAVVWISPASGALLDERKVEISLIGSARLVQGQSTRSGDRLFVSGIVRGNIRITAENRSSQDQSASSVYQAASSLRPVDVASAAIQNRSSAPPMQQRWNASKSTANQATSVPTPVIQPRMTFNLQVPGELRQINTPDGNLAASAQGGILLIAKDGKGNLIEFQAQSGVFFTDVNSASELKAPTTNIQQVIREKLVAVYLEGDVRVVYTSSDPGKSDQRMTASHVYYELATDRAILTDAVLHTVDLRKQVPIIIRAQTLRQLAQGEYSVENGQLTTSAFATPSYALAAEKIYVRQTDTGDLRLGRRTVYSGSNVTFQAYGLPVFWLPAVGGSMTDHGDPVRDIEIQQSTTFGFGPSVTLGLFEVAGKIPPPDLDASLQLGYFDLRGPFAGLNAKYDGGFISDTTAKPWNFSGDFQSDLIDDRGRDRLGASRGDVDPPRDIRGTFLWQHQHFFPSDWQLQLRAGYVSDATFLEQWYKDIYNNGQSRDLSLYLKRQRDTEAFTLFGNVQTSRVVTSAESVQEQYEIERQPEIGYRRLGDSLGTDSITAYSTNTVGGYKFDQSSASLAQQGYLGSVTPGQPSLNNSVTPDGVTYRGDFRQELDLPFSTGRFRWVPYVFGRYTAYSDSPTNNSQDRVYVGTGVRITTAFWAVNDSVQSDLFDLHRIRHVIEPEVNLYTSAQSLDSNKLFQYDEEVDKINDVTAAQIALRQRWQTKRGGPGRWRSVDFLTLNLEANLFANQPGDPLLNPNNFRGLFFSSMPEASIPRNSFNADATWRVTDSTAILADMQHNFDRSQLATASIGLAATRGDRTTFFIGNRYIEELHTNITSASMDYELNRKYVLSLSQSFDFGQSQKVGYSAGLTRRFDRFYVVVKVGYDETAKNTSFQFALQPLGSRPIGITSDQLSQK